MNRNCVWPSSAWDYHASESTDTFLRRRTGLDAFGSGRNDEYPGDHIQWRILGQHLHPFRHNFGAASSRTLSKENNVKLEGQFGVMMPSTGEILKLGNASGNGLPPSSRKASARAPTQTVPSWKPGRL